MEATAFSNPGYPDPPFNPITEPFSNIRLSNSRPQYDVTPPATAPVDNDDVDLTVLMKADEYFKCSTLTSKSSPTNVDTSDVIQQQHVNNERSRSKVNGNVLYGELVVYGTTPSRFPGGNSARRRSKLQLRRRCVPNGVVPHKDYFSNQAGGGNMSIESHGSSSSHVISYSLSRSRAYVVEYAECPSIDLFQIGRSTESNIDMVLIDTIPGATKLEDCTKSESTISRYACRITVERELGVDYNGDQIFKPRIYAAGFDSNRSIQLGEKALKWELKGIPDSKVGSPQIDGLTTNGVLILNPDEKGNFSRSTWREVSICGHVYTMRDTKNKTVVHRVPDETNELRDGCLIDLCGATLLWRSAAHCHSVLNETDFVEKVQKEINNKRPQCPISFNTLYLPKTKRLPDESPRSRYLNDKHETRKRRTRTHCFARFKKAKTSNTRRHSRTPLPEIMENNPASVDISRESSFNVSSKPYACFPCGHVYGYFEPIKKKEEENSGGSEAQRHNRSSNNKRECPLCRQESTFVALSLGDEPAFHMDAEEPTYAFNPCGHTCSLATAKHWSSVLIPSSSGGKRMCPFCAVTLEGSGYVSLMFQDRFI